MVRATVSHVALPYRTPYIIPYITLPYLIPHLTLPQLT